MKTRMLIAAMAALVVMAVGSHELSAAKEAKKVSLDGVTCPVSGKAVKAEATVDYKGGQVYFCCPNCPKAFAANTAKFAAKANHQLAATKQAKLSKCVFTGKKLNPETKIDVSGVAICFCCAKCQKKATSVEGADQIELVFSDKTFAKGYTVGSKKKSE